MIVIGAGVGSGVGSGTGSGVGSGVGEGVGSSVSIAVSISSGVSGSYIETDFQRYTWSKSGCHLPNINTKKTHIHCCIKLSEFETE